jgi:hypothetical protein
MKDGKKVAGDGMDLYSLQELRVSSHNLVVTDSPERQISLPDSWADCTI